MYEALLVIFLLVALCLVSLIILQKSTGADIGASFGASRASATLFGSSCSGNFMTLMAAMLATLFFVLSLVLGNMSSQWDNLSQPSRVEQPATQVEPAINIPK
ncbi:MAG: preprotein translocase subunit SecG [Candidatus Malihini olakiniferum]